MSRTCTRKRGMTLAEVVVTSGLMSILLLAMGAVYKIGIVGLSKTTAHADMLSQAQIAAAKLSREVASSSFDSLTLSPDHSAASFLIRIDEKGEFGFDPINGRPLWQSYVVYYVEGDELKRRVLPLPEAAPLADATPIEEYAPWGKKPISEWCSNGSTVARSLRTCLFENFSGRLQLTLVAEKQRLGKKDPETVELSFITRFRNRR